MHANRSASSAPATSGWSPLRVSPSWATRSSASTSTPRRSRRSSAGEIPIYEPGLEDLVARNRERLHFSTDIADALERARLLFVAVGTPPTYSGDADLSAVNAVVDAMPRVRPPRAGDEVDRAGRHRARRSSGASPRPGKEGFRYVSCPEFLKEGSAVADFLHPDRVVVGDDGDWAGDAVVELYAPLDAPLVRTDIASAEMVKLASNAFLATKISFINEIANVCEETGADVVEVAKGMGLDDRIGPKFLQAGIGFGGSCFPKDVSALKQLAGNSGYHFQLLNAVIEVNELQKRRVDRQAAEAPRHARRQAHRAARPGLQARTPTTCARPPRSCSSARLQADGAGGRRLRPDRRGRGARADPRRATSPRTRWTRAGRRRRGARHRVAEFSELDWSAGRRRDGGHARHRRAQRARPRRGPRRRPDLRGRRPQRRRGWTPASAACSPA